MTTQQIDIFVADVTDMEARVYARYAGTEPVCLRGTVRGPFCEKARTLAAEFVFRDLSPQSAGMAEAIVIDPCLWSTAMPHLYRVEVEAIRGEQVLSEYHGTIGLHRLAPRRPVDFAPGTG